MPSIRPRVVTAADVRLGSVLLTADQPAAKEDPYLAKVVKYIPGEVVAAYVTGAGIIRSMSDDALCLWIWSGLLALMSGVWTAVMTREDGQPVALFQALTAPVATAVWIFALGGPFEVQFGEHYDPGMGSLALIAFTLIVPPAEKIFVK